MAYSTPAVMAPVTQPKSRGDGPMSDEDFRAVVSRALAESVNYVETELSPDRARATDYYLGKPFGNEEEGRSQVILTEVRDAVDGTLPDLVEVIHGPEHVMEFIPRTADKVEEAAQRTDYVRYVYEQDNQGLFVTHDLAKDGLVRKIGIVKWWWDETIETKSFRQEHISRQDLDLLSEQDGVEIVSAQKLRPTKEEKAEFAMVMQQYEQAAMSGAPVPQPTMPEYYDVEFTRTPQFGRACVECIPTEEFLVNRGARSTKTAKVLFHRTRKTRGELLAMGVKASDIDEYGAASSGTSDALSTNFEELSRRQSGPVGSVSLSTWGNDPEMGKANQGIIYAEGLMRVDRNGDGIAEWRHVCTLGPTYVPIQDYPEDGSIGFAVFSPYREPHVLVGGSMAERTMDMQKINSALLRGGMDSLAASIFPRLGYVEGQVAPGDIMNNAVGAPLRMRVANAIQVIETQFVGKEVLPMLAFTQEIIERRTGKDKGSAGLDADALQSTDPAAVQAVLQGKNKQMALMARNLVETLKDVFIGLARMLKAHQDHPRMVRLRGAWTNVDPRAWDDEMDVMVNVALGSMFTDKKIATLVAVAQDQQHWIETMGLDNPMVSLPMLRNTRAKVLALQGMPDVDTYYKPFPPGWQPPAPQPPPPPPELLAMQQEKEMNELKTIKELAIKQDELRLKQQQQEWDHEFRMRELATNAELKKYQIDMQFQQGLTTAQLEANIAQDEAEARLTIDAHDQLHDQELERNAQEHEQEMAQQQLTNGSDSGASA